MRTDRLALFLVVFAWVFASIVVGQTLIVDVNLAVLTVRVHDQQGKPVLDLAPQDFEVFEDGHARPLSHFSIETQPAAIGVLVDRSISVGPVRDALSRTVVQICKALRPDDQAFLMTFSTASKLDVPLTTDHDAIVSAIRRLRPAAGTRFYDAAIDALDELARSSRANKTLVILTDGADHYSDHTFQQTLSIGRLYGIPVDVFAYSSNDSRAWTAAGRSELREQLRELTQATGGQLIVSTPASDPSAAVHVMLESVHRNYELGFYSSGEIDESSNIDIRIRKHPEFGIEVAR